MAPKLWTCLLALFGIHKAVAVTYLQPSQYCVASCNVAIKQVSFDGMQPAAKSSSSPVPCTNQHFIESLFYCATQYCGQTEVYAGLDARNETCLTQAGKSLPSYDFWMRDAGPLGNIMVVDSKAVKAQNFTEPIIPNQAFYDLGMKSTASITRNLYYNWTFAWALYGYWGLIVFAGILNRTIKSLRHATHPNPTLISGSSFTREPSSFLSRTSNRLRRHLLLPLAIGSKRETPLGWCSLPTRVEALVIAVYVAMCFAFCFPGHDVFAGNLYSPNPKIQLGMYVCRRVGTLAVANLPLVWVFSARNDPLMWITGWSYATFSQFHRWCARVLAVLALAHGIGYSIVDGYMGRYKMAWELDWLICGPISVISISVLVATSVFWMRKRWYDVFLAIHVVFALVLLVGLYFHLKYQHGAFNGFIWPAVAIWSLDRLLRLARLVYLSVKPNANGIKATATWDESMDLIRVDVTDFFQDKKTTPGMFYFVYEPSRLRGYESHPFTLCTWHYAVPQSRAESSSSFDEKEKIGDDLSPVPPTSTADFRDVEFGTPERINTHVTIPEKRKTAESRHTFLIRPRAGYTNRLRNKTCSDSSEEGEISSRRFRVLLEGPYGTALSMHQYSTVVMIIGGAGITAAISRIYDLLRCPNAPNKVHLVWATQRLEMVDDVCTHELNGVLAMPRFRLDVYLTRTSAMIERRNSKPAAYNFFAGRPNVLAILKEEREKSAGSMAVFCCGPPALEAGCRNSVVGLLGEKGPHVAFYEERFGW